MNGLGALSRWARLFQSDGPKTEDLYRVARKVLRAQRVRSGPRAAGERLGVVTSFGAARLPTDPRAPHSAQRSRRGRWRKRCRSRAATWREGGAGLESPCTRVPEAEHSRRAHLPGRHPPLLQSCLIITQLSSLASSSSWRIWASGGWRELRPLVRPNKRPCKDKELRGFSRQLARHWARVTRSYSCRWGPCPSPTTRLVVLFI